MSSPSTVERLWRRVHPGHNPLVRRIDRVEIRLMVTFVLLAILSIPLVAAVGSEIYVDRAAQANEQKLTRTATSAVLLEAAPDYQTGLRQDQTETGSKVSARWHVDGSERTGLVEAPFGAAEGTEIPIWVDRDGRLVAPPLTTADAAVVAIMSAAGLWVAVVAAVSLCCWLTREIINRVRYAAWDRDWLAMGRQEDT